MKERQNCGWDLLSMCWDCERCLGGCSWSREFKPVEGWLATPTTIVAAWKTPGEPQRTVNSYHITYCPQFKRDAYGFGRKRIKQDDPQKETTERRGDK